jgi:hypothetical protein
MVLQSLYSSSLRKINVMAVTVKVMVSGHGWGRQRFAMLISVTNVCFVSCPCLHEAAATA